MQDFYCAVLFVLIVSLKRNKRFEKPTDTQSETWVKYSGGNFQIPVGVLVTCFDILDLIIWYFNVSIKSYTGEIQIYSPM